MTAVIAPPTRHRPQAARPVMTVVVGAWRPGRQLAACVENVRSVTTGYRTEIIVASNTPWTDAPPGIKVITTPSASRGNRFDAAGHKARGKFIAFIDDWVRLRAGWQEQAMELLQDDRVAVVGGPVLAPRQLPARMRGASVILHSRVGIGPRRYLFSRQSPRRVDRLATFNLVVRRDAFQEVGGFQSPTRWGDGARLCYKVRVLLKRDIVYHPGLAVEAPPPALGGPLLALVARRGRHRGDMARRMPEASPLMPYGLPALGLLAVALLAVASPFLPPARLALLAAPVLYAIVGLGLFIASMDPGAGLLAALALPFVHLAFALGFWRGYLGRSAGELSPPRQRSRPLRILVFNWRDVTHPWAGGAETYMHELSRRWTRAGCEVGWVCERRGSAPRHETIDGIDFHRMGGPFTLYARAALAYVFSLRRRYDIVVDCENGIPFFTPFYCRKPIVLVVHHVHQEVFRRELPAYQYWLASWLEGSLMPRAYRRHRVAAVSESTRGLLGQHKFDVSRIDIINNGVDVSPAPTVTRRSSLSLLYLGRLKPYKSVDDLIGAMPAICRAYPGAQLDIVGQGPDRERLERLTWINGMAGKIRFHGYLSNAVRDQLLNRASMLICPSAFEGWGVVCMEASARGLPVVAADVSGLRDSVLDGVTGKLFKHGDRNALADSVISLIGNPGRRRQMGQAGRTWAAQHSWDQSADTFLELMSELTSISWRSSERAVADAVADQALAPTAS